MALFLLNNLVGTKINPNDIKISVLTL